MTLSEKIATALQKTQAWARGDYVEFVVHPEPPNEVLRGKTGHVETLLCVYCARQAFSEICYRCARKMKKFPL